MSYLGRTRQVVRSSCTKIAASQEWGKTRANDSTLPMLSGQESVMWASAENYLQCQTLLWLPLDLSTGHERILVNNWTAPPPMAAPLMLESL